MPSPAALVVLLASPGTLFTQAALQPAQPVPPTLEEVRQTMGIPSRGDVRGQQDAVGFASKPEQMAKVWELSATLPRPEKLGDPPPPGVAGAICPHDDYIYAGRVYRQVLPLVTAKTVVLVGVFHKYRRFGAHDVLVFDSYKAWRTPDGDVPVSEIREEVLALLPKGDFVRDDAAHDSEHSLEAIVYWLRHARPDLQIAPVIVPAMGAERMEELAGRLASALARVMTSHRLQLGARRGGRDLVRRGSLRRGLQIRAVRRGRGRRIREGVREGSRTPPGPARGSRHYRQGGRILLHLRRPGATLRRLSADAGATPSHGGT
jgi:hypothetical protein